MCNVIRQNLVLLLLVNIMINVTDLISGIYTNFRTFLPHGVVVSVHNVMR